MIKIFIADDEPLAREEFRRLIAGHTDFEVVGEAGSGTEALKKIKEKAGEIDVVFLDIEMPGLNGLEVASKLCEWPNPPCVVFATAYNQYAVEAFEASALDYLLKPYATDRFEKTLERLRDHFKIKEGQREKIVSLEDNLIEKGFLKKLMGHHRNSKDRKVVDFSEVYYFYANNTEVFARLADDELIIKSTLKELTESLSPTDFVQTHKAHIVNVNHIKKVAPMFSGNFEITLTNESCPQIPLSRRYAKTLKEQMGGW